MILPISAMVCTRINMIKLDGLDFQSQPPIFILQEFPGKKKAAEVRGPMGRWKRHRSDFKDSPHECDIQQQGICLWRRNRLLENQLGERNKTPK